MIKRNKIALNALVVLILLSSIFFMTGCRESMVIQQIIYDQASEDIDFQNELKTAQSNDDSQNEDEDMPEEKTDKSDKKSEEKHVASQLGKTKNNGSASDTKHNKDAKSNKKNNSNGTKTGDKGDKNKPSKDDGTAGPTDDPNKRQIYDNNGNLVELPEKVNSVVAAGDAAYIVQMLGGTGIVKGTSGSVTGSSWSSAVLGSDVKTLWDGDGSSAMSSSAFSKLLKMKPDACVISDGGSFSASQLKQLKDKGIACVSLPSMNSADSIQSAVDIAADMIGDRSGENGGKNAHEMASEYESYCNGLVKDVQGKTGLFTWNGINFRNGKKNVSNSASDGQYTLYLSGWSSGSYKITNDNGSTLLSDSGVAVAKQGYSDSPLSYYLSVAGVCNNGARFVNDSKSQYAVTPLNRNVFNHSTSSQFSFYSDKNESFARAWNGGSIDSALGNSDFRALLAEDSATANKIKNSKAWKSYGKTNVGNITDYGFEAGGKLVTSYVRGNYDIYVNPSGVCSWTGGSLESVLESKWAAWKYHGTYSESQVKDEIKKFYKKFYSHDLSDSEVNSILAGK